MPDDDVRLLLVEQSIPQPDKSAGDRNIWEFVRTLRGSGVRVTFWPLINRDYPEESEALRLMGVDVIVGTGRSPFGSWIRHEKFDRILICRPHVAEAYLGAIPPTATSQLAYYGHDLHFQRMEMEAEVLRDAKIAASASRMKSKETSIWRAVDIVLYPTEEEAAEVKALQFEVDARAVQIFCFDEFPRRVVAPEAPVLLFVGNFRHAPNVDAAKHLVGEVMPKLRQLVPTVSLRIAGANTTDEVRGLAGRDIHVLDWLSAEDLKRNYQEARAVVVPLRFGAGLKLKVVEAMMEGVPLVTSSVGAQGLPELRDIGGVSDTVEQFVYDTARILALSQAEWLAISSREVDFAEAHFSRLSMLNSLYAALDLPSPVKSR